MFCSHHAVQLRPNTTIAYTILASKDAEDREYKSLEAIKGDNYLKYVATMDRMVQERNGMRHGLVCPHGSIKISRD